MSEINTNIKSSKYTNAILSLNIDNQRVNIKRIYFVKTTILNSINSPQNIENENSNKDCFYPDNKRSFEDKQQKNMKSIYKSQIYTNNNRNEDFDFKLASKDVNTKRLNENNVQNNILPSINNSAISQFSSQQFDINKKQYILVPKYDPETIQQKNVNFLRFKDRYDLKMRKKCAQQAKIGFPNKLSLIIEPSNQMLKTNYIITQKITNPKFMMPKYFLISDVLFIIRQRFESIEHSTNTYTNNNLNQLNEAKSQGMVLSIGNTILRPNQSLQDVYNKYKDDDDFLYINYSNEQAFG